MGISLDQSHDSPPPSPDDLCEGVEVGRECTVIGMVVNTNLTVGGRLAVTSTLEVAI